MGWGEAMGPDQQVGWHPVTDEDTAILRAELDACRAEIARLRAVALAADEYFRGPSEYRCRRVLNALAAWRLGT